MTHWTKLLHTACSFLLMTAMLQAQSFYTLQGKIIDEENKPLSLATIRVLPADLSTQSQADGSFSLRIPAHLREISLQISHVGKEPVSRLLTVGQYGQFQLIRLLTLSLKLTEVEVNAVRRNTASSNSSILFDREAIEQVQPLSVANVLNYLPGQTILRQGVSVQGIQTLNLRSATNPATLLAGGSSQARSVMETQNLNETFGLTVMVDGAPLSNNANMQFSNTSFMGMFSSNNITNPDAILADRAQRNGTLYSAYGGLYGGAQANTGLDLRSIGV
ncbi:MAG: carboxypeptidase-like regulatory domain-containing protein, partial [Chitinophagaceae bacterium]|nr:carboxypeptidase-like regulatory domain-containing protein [Chitinophagaceae bacterium]